MIQLQHQRTRYVRLGKANWTDPDRRQSIKINPRVKMKWRIRDGPRRKKCWVALPPASIALGDAIEQIETSLAERNRDFFDGEITAPACSYDATMFGGSIEDAQPTVIFSSSSEICRRNAKNIIADKQILVDPRGIGMEYYSIGPQFFTGIEAGNSRKDAEGSKSKLSHDPASSQGSSDSSKQSIASTLSIPPGLAVPFLKRSINGELVLVGSSSCTVGGIVAIDDQLFGLTVAHAFERNSSQQEEQLSVVPTYITRFDGIAVGLLSEKRHIGPRSQKDLDWALCTLDRSMVHVTSCVSLPNGISIYPTQVATQVFEDTEVWVHTGTTGVLKGFVLHNHSLVSLPGGGSFQRMWIVVLDRLVLPGDCGSWVIDENGTFYGHIVAAKSETRIAYILLARDIFRDIRDQFGGRHVRLPQETNLVSEAVASVKHDISISSSATRITSSEDHTVAFKTLRGFTSSVTSPRSRNFNKPSSSSTSPTVSFPRSRALQRLDTRNWDVESSAADLELYPSSQARSKQDLMRLLRPENVESVAIRQATDWYIQYLEVAFLKHTTHFLVPVLKGFSELFQLHRHSTPNHDVCDRKYESYEAVYFFLFNLARMLMEPHGRTLENIAAEMRDLEIFLVSAKPLLQYQLLTLAIGWLTMATPQVLQSREDIGEMHIKPEEMAQLRDQSISQILRRFEFFESSIDPPPAYNTYGQSPPTQHYLGKTINFRSLKSIGLIKVEWTNQLLQHLQFDSASRTLTLFAFPSFAYMMHSRTSILSEMMNDLRSTYDEGRSVQRQSPFTADNLLREILLTYRLLFGVDANSRRAFKKYLKDFQSHNQRDAPEDPLLMVLCGQPWTSTLPSSIYHEIHADLLRNSYTLDFPLFGQRLYQLYTFVHRQHPNTLLALWHDRRDVTRWWTFWGVVILFGFTLFIGFLQIILAAWEIWLAEQQLQNLSS